MVDTNGLAFLAILGIIFMLLLFLFIPPLTILSVVWLLAPHINYDPSYWIIWWSLFTPWSIILIFIIYVIMFKK